MEKVDIFALIDELQEEIELSPTRGLSKNKSVDAKIVMEIIEDIKQALHEELDFSRRVVGEKDQILNAAQTQADPGQPMTKPPSFWRTASRRRRRSGRAPTPMPKRYSTSWRTIIRNVSA